MNIAQVPAVEPAIGPHAGPAVMNGADEARGWTRILLRYREPSLLRSILELGITFGPLAALWVVMWLCYSVGLWWVTLL